MRRMTVLACLTGAFLGLPAMAGGEEDTNRDTYLLYQCWQCHGYEGQGGAAPRIARRNFPLAAFRRFVRYPAVMPAYSPAMLPDEDLRRILAFLKSRPAPPTPDALRE